MNLARALSLALLISILAFAAEIPRPAPADFLIPFPDGRTIKVGEMKGKVVVVEFLLTTCPGCQNAARILTKLMEEYGPKGVEVVGIAVNQAAERDIGNFITKSGATFPVGYRTLEAGLGFLQIPVVNRTHFPQMVFIDRAGVIRAQRGGEEEAFFIDEEKNIREELDKLVKPPVRKAAAAKKP